MELIPLNAGKPQELQLLLGNNVWDISIKLGKSGSVLVSVTINGTAQISGLLAVAQQDLMFTPALARYGHLMFDCTDGSSYPDIDQLGITHNLYWWGVNE